MLSDSLAMMVTAFGLVAALAWNEAIKTLISEVIPKGQGLLSQVIYAILVTVVAVLVSTRLIGLKQHLEDSEKK